MKILNVGLELSGSRGVITSRDFDSMLEQSIGNMLNVIIFGMRYSEDNPVWNRIQKLRSDGIKELSVAGDDENGSKTRLSALRKLCLLITRTAQLQCIFMGDPNCAPFQLMK